jgi:lysyl oxidase
MLRTRRRWAGIAVVVLASAAISLGADAGPAAAGVNPDARPPDLAVLPPSDLRIIVRESGRRVLRFTSIVVNVGRGPFQLAGYDPVDEHASKNDILAVRQQILEADGTFSSHVTAATMFWSGDGHNHWHVTDIQVAELHSLEAEDLPGSYKKTGFCFFDSYRYTSTKPGFYTPARNVCQTRSSGRVRMGVSVRWADIYPSSIAYQWIDVSEVPDGRYKLKVFADASTAEAPAGTFIESDETNNVGWAKIRISGNSVTVLSRSARP